ncbi:MAG: beta-ketoacyl synthase N-terminal-like domain-containing protein [Myxococcota bacterium]
MRDVLVTGLGCWTALGADPDEVFEALCRGGSGVDGPGPFPGRGPVAAIPGGPHLSSTLAERVVRQALGGLDPAGVALVGATTSGDMVRGEVEYERVLRGEPPGPEFLWAQLCDRPTEIVARVVGLTGPRTSLSTACSSGAAAVGIAAEWVASGRVEAAVAFGTDALCQMTVHGFGSLGAVSPDRCRPFDAGRTGLSLGEGAGALLLESAESAARRGARVLARFGGYGNATDAHHMTAPHPEGRGALDAVRQAGTARVGWVCAHGTATPLNDAMESGVVAAVLPEAAVSSIKGAIGHTLGAAGAIELVATVQAVQQGRVPPNTGCLEPEWPLDLVSEARHVPLDAALSVNFAFGGHNAAVRIERADHERIGADGPSRPSDPIQPVQGAVLDWAACVPGGAAGLADDLRAGRSRGTSVDDPARPDAIPAGRWRRMSRLSRLAAVAVLELRERHPDLDWASMPVVHGTAMGEVVPSSAFLDRLFTEGPEHASPMSFQNSVYNATAAHLSLTFDLRGPAETVSSGIATGIMALARGFEWARRAPAVLVVVGDDLNPTTLNAFANTPVPAGEAMVAVLVGPGSDVRIVDGDVAERPVCRGTPLPYERAFVAREGARPEAVLGLSCANGLLAVLAGLPEVLDQDDRFALTALRASP